MTTKYQHAETTGTKNRSAAERTASHGIAFPAVPALQKKSPEEDELKMKSIAQLAKPEEDELQMKSVVQLAKPEEEELQMKSITQLAKPDEEELQMKSVNGMGEIFRRKVEAVALKANQTGMPDQLKAGIENLAGFSMDDVKVHYNSDKPAQLNALAYAQGANIHIGPGQERHLPHEAWHVVQQKQGRVGPTLQAKGISINDDKELEKEASLMGKKALSISLSVNSLPLLQVSTQPSNLLTQRQEIITFGGKFKADEYILTEHEPKEGGEKGIGCKMNLEFYANDTVNCDKIGLTQTTTPTLKKGENSRENYAANRGLSRAIKDTINGELVDKSRYLDRTNENIHPVFGARNPTKDPDLVPESFHSEEDKLGAHALNDFGKVTKDEPARLLDEPGRDWKNGWAVIQSFETTALCLTGPLKGDYLGSVEWGYTYGPNDGGNVLPLKKISDGVPSKKFIEAVVEWNKTKISKKNGEDLATVSLPSKERIGTSKALSLPHRKFILDTIDTLSLTSVINLLENPVFSEHSRQLLMNKFYRLISTNSLIFAKNWLRIYQERKTLQEMLRKLRDEYSNKEWGTQKGWTLDSGVRGVIRKGDEEEVKAKDLLKLLNSEENAPIFYCLNDNFSASTIIDSSMQFDVPYNLLNKQAKELE